MPNILLTQKCVRSCPYCFAQKHMDESPPEDMMTWENLIYIADLLETSGEKGVSLLGGEPFLHPYIVDFVLYLLERNLHVNIFTSGIMSDKMFREARKFLSNIEPDRLSFVCNVNNPEISPSSELERTRRFLKEFGRLTNLGFNIYKNDFEMDFLFQYINEFGLKRHIRIGLAHPIPGEKNVFIKKENLPQFAERFISYAPMFERFRVDPGFDCGIPLCLFSDEQLGKLYKINKGNLKFGCGPAIDIGPDMMVWSCFPLSRYQKKSLYEFDSLQDILQFYHENLHSKVRIEASGIFEKCDTCVHREDGICTGGCLAHNLTHFMNEAPIRFREVYIDE